MTTTGNGTAARCGYSSVLLNFSAILKPWWLLLMVMHIVIRYRAATKLLLRLEKDFLWVSCCCVMTLFAHRWVWCRTRWTSPASPTWTCWRCLSVSWLTTWAACGRAPGSPTAACSWGDTSLKHTNPSWQVGLICIHFIVLMVLVLTWQAANVFQPWFCSEVASIQCHVRTQNGGE